MKSIIVGAGVVGQALAEQLSLEGHRVSVVDLDKNAVKDLNEKLDVLAVQGSGSSPKVLERAGIAQADMIIAVTNVDEVNMIVALVAERYGVLRKIIRVRNEEFTTSNSILGPEDLGFDSVINPEPAIVKSIVDMLNIPGANDVAHMAGGEVSILGFDIFEDSPVAGMTTREVREQTEFDAFLLLYIRRGDEVLMPRGDDRVLPGDKVNVLVGVDDEKRVAAILQRDPIQMHRVVIAGATRVGMQLARAIEGQVERCVMIESDPELAEEAAMELQNTTVLCGSATAEEMLKEAAIDRCDLFCALSDDDQQNMLSGLVAKRHGARKTAVWVQHPDYVAVLAELGLDIVINPRLVTVSEILMHVRRGKIYGVTRLQESHAEILEMEAPPGAKITKKPIANQKLPSDALIGAVVRDGSVMIPKGDTQIEGGDHVIIFAMPDAISKIEQLFSP